MGIVGKGGVVPREGVVLGISVVGGEVMGGAVRGVVIGGWVGMRVGTVTGRGVVRGGVVTGSGDAGLAEQEAEKPLRLMIPSVVILMVSAWVVLV